MTNRVEQRAVLKPLSFAITYQYYVLLDLKHLLRQAESSYINPRFNIVVDSRWNYESEVSKKFNGKLLGLVVFRAFSIQIQPSSSTMGPEPEKGEAGSENIPNQAYHSFAHLSLELDITLERATNHGRCSAADIGA